MSEVVHSPRPLQQIWEDMLNSESDTIISKLSWRPAFVLDSMISIQESIQIPPPLSDPQHLSIGRLDALPLEILHIILNLLDFRTLSRLTRTSHLAKTTVESLPAYRDLIKHATKALLALSKSQVIEYHSAETLHSALRSENCNTCQSFAPFLYLLTCKRCCFNCVRSGGPLGLSSQRLVRVLFGLTPEEICRIPTLLNIPGTYFEDPISLHRERIGLVASKHIRELGIPASEEALKNYCSTLRALGRFPIPEIPSQERFEMGFDSRNCWHLYEPLDPFRGMGSVFFPILRQDQSLDDGLWCLGCHLLRENDIYQLELQALSLLPTKDRRLKLVVSARECQAWSRAGFVDHVKQCQCARYVLRDLENGSTFSTS